MNNEHIHSEHLQKVYDRLFSDRQYKHSIHSEFAVNYIGRKDITLLTVKVNN